MISIRPLSLKCAKALDDVLSERLEVVERVGEKFVPETGGLGEVRFAGGVEEGLVLARGDNFALEIIRKLGLEDRMGKLFQQNWRQVQVAVQRDAVALEVAEDAQQRQVGFGGCLMQPLHAVRPGAVIHHVRQVRMQRKTHIAGGFCRHNRGVRFLRSSFRRLRNSFRRTRGASMRCTEAGKRLY